VVPLLYGNKGSGKSSMMSLLIKLLGNYGQVVDHELLSSNRRESVVADLHGVRFAMLDEAPPTSRTGTEQLKTVTGGVPMRGAHKFQASFQIKSTWTLGMTSNDDPIITDGAIRRRIRLLPCNTAESVVEPLRKELERRWWAEAPGILAAMMSRTARWLTDPSLTHLDKAPDIVRTAAEDLVAEQDHLGQWLTSVEVEADDIGTAPKDLYRTFSQWWLRHHLPIRDMPSTHRFGRQLTEAGYGVRKGGNGVRRRPLRLTGQLDEPPGSSTWSPPPREPAGGNYPPESHSWPSPPTSYPPVSGALGP
jgi:phage/plasmid-associated DNA primase